MHTTIISCEELAIHLADSDWVVCDCRHDLGDYHYGQRAYQGAHIPGARFVHLDEDLSGPKTGVNGRHPLPHPLTFVLRLGALGIDTTTQVVTYDSSGGCYAARLWWMLRWVGHSKVAVLDGGWEAWTQAALPVTAEMPSFEPAAYTARPRTGVSVDPAYLTAHLNDRSTAIVDARSPDRFRGENESIDPVAGHIPGAVNRFFKLNLDSNGRFKAPDALRAEFGAILGDTPPEAAIHQCGSGVTACHNLLAMERAGLGGSRLFPGSWSEWISDRSRPVTR